MNRDTVFLVHGIDAAGATFDEVRPELAAVFDVETCEYPGFAGWAGFGGVLSIAFFRRGWQSALFLMLGAIAAFGIGRRASSPSWAALGTRTGLVLLVSASLTLVWARYRRERPRATAARYVRERMHAVVAERPLAAHAHVIAHSFGAYLLTQYAQEPPTDLRFGTAILLSAPLPRTLDLAPHLRALPAGGARFKALHHEVGVGDKDVRLVRELAKFEGPTFGDAGAEGFAPSDYLHRLHDPLDFCPQCAPSCAPAERGLMHESHFPRREHDVLRFPICARDYWVPILMNVHPGEYQHLRLLARRIHQHRRELGEHWLTSSPPSDALNDTFERARRSLRCFRGASLVDALVTQLTHRVGTRDLRGYNSIERLLTQWAELTVAARLAVVDSDKRPIGRYADPRIAVRETVARISGVR